MACNCFDHGGYANCLESVLDGNVYVLTDPLTEIFIELGKKIEGFWADIYCLKVLYGVNYKKNSEQQPSRKTKIKLSFFYFLSSN